MEIIKKYSNSMMEEDDEYDRKKEVKGFDDSKIGVKGLVDSNPKIIPRMFIRPAEELLKDSKTPLVNREIPVIDLQDIVIGNKKGSLLQTYSEIVEQVLKASENWGFFQVLNHGVPLQRLEKMLEGVKMFHEQDTEVKKDFYSRDRSRQVGETLCLFIPFWRDFENIVPIMTSLNRELPIGETLCLFIPLMPQISRGVMREYINEMLKLSEILLELVWRALGLKEDGLKEMECNKGWTLVNHYYPACPAPELTLGGSQHTDPTFITILLQDQIGGLQVLHQNQWVHVHPIPDFLVPLLLILEILN